MEGLAEMRRKSGKHDAVKSIAVLIALIVPCSHARGLLSSPYIPTQVQVTTTLPVIDIFNAWQPATFTATVVSASDAQPLGPSDGVVLFTMTGSNAFSFVHKTVLGTAKVSRVAVSGTASLTLHKDSAGLTLLPGLYNVTAEFSSSGIYQASAGSTIFRIGIDSLPVQWGVSTAT